MNTQLIQQLGMLGLSVEPKPETKDTRAGVLVSGRLGAVRKFTDQMPKIKQFAFENAYNASRYAEEFTKSGKCNGNGDDDRWKGGSFSKLLSDLSGEVDMRPFLDAKTKLEESDAASRVKHIFVDGRPKRTRVRSEHDGDWNYQNRWDIKPYDAAIRTRPPIKAITMIADFSISAWTGADSINRYGALIWAISDLLETSGINTKIVWRNRVKNVATKGGDGVDLETNIILKEPGEYLSAQNLAGSLTSVFFRRSGFGIMVAAADCISATSEPGLGQPVPSPSVLFEDGQLSLASSVEGLTPEVEKELYKALHIGNHKQRAAEDARV